MVSKVRRNITIREDYWKILEKEAKNRQTSVDEVIDKVLAISLHIPNEETIEAIEEVRSGVDLDDFSFELLDECINKL